MAMREKLEKLVKEVRAQLEEANVIVYCVDVMAANTGDSEGKMNKVTTKWSIIERELVGVLDDLTWLINDSDNVKVLLPDGSQVNAWVCTVDEDPVLRNSSMDVEVNYDIPNGKSYPDNLGRVVYDLRKLRPMHEQGQPVISAEMYEHMGRQP